MSLFNTIKTGASGLGASGSSLAVIGDNIANINTRGFKKGRIAFSDVMPQYIGGVNGMSQLGRGAATSGVNTLHQQGGFQSSGSALDLAIGGDGFFQVSDEGRNYYTRDGSFRVDSDNFITTMGGMQLMGYAAENGEISATAGPLQLDVAPLPPKVTSLITLAATLPGNQATTFGDTDGDGVAGDTELAGLALLADGGLSTQADPTPGTTPTLGELDGKADFSTSTTIYDSRGQAHEVTVMFEQSGENTWTYHAFVDGAELDTDGDGVPDEAQAGALQVATGTLTFDGAELASVAAGTALPGAQWSGAEDWTPEFDFGGPDGGAGEIAIGGKDDPGSAISLQQDGYASAFLTGLRVEGDGVIMGQYDNGEDLVMGQVALAKFNANDGLTRAGGNLYEATLASGDATLGVAGTGGRGAVSGYALESSNVDLEDEFVNMIQSQRSYQANASTIRASDESLQTLVQLV
ncbi:MAG: flagellar hook protein FlgE [Myxococcota bacterium]